MRYAARMRRREPAGKARDREVEASPEEMHRADLADKTGPEQREHAMRAEQNAPEARGVVAVVGSVHTVTIERNGVGDLVRHRVDTDVDAKLGQRGEQIDIELRHRHRRQHELTEM